MKNLLFTLLFLVGSSSVMANDFTYEGDWYTVRNRRLEGKMTSVVTWAGEKNGVDQWKGKFYGVWHGVRFSYDVVFSGKPDKLVGKATVDGVSYDWKGKLTKQNFTGEFESHRYDGTFSLKRK
jgi:hypothetical protein